MLYPSVFLMMAQYPVEMVILIMSGLATSSIDHRRYLRGCRPFTYTVDVSNSVAPVGLQSPTVHYKL